MAETHESNLPPNLDRRRDFLKRVAGAGVAIALLSEQSIPEAQARSTTAESVISIAGEWSFELPSPETLRQAIGISKWFWKSGTAAEAAQMAAPSADTSTDSWQATNTKKPQMQFVGTAWFRATLPALDHAGRTLRFTHVDDNGVIYLNGKKLMSHQGWRPAFEVSLDSAWRSDGPNILTVLVDNISGPGGIYGPVNFGFIAATKWFKRRLKNTIELPGSCQQRGFGEKTTYHAIGRLTPLIEYVGPAWYQREITIPAAWHNQRVELFLERCHWESTVWLGNQRIGSQNSLSVPHVYDLGVLAPGRHRLTICIDNTIKLNIGEWSNAITSQTQGNWNGIIGKMELRATDTAWVKDVQVYPQMAKNTLQIKIFLGNQTGQPLPATITVEVKKTALHASGQYTIPKDGGQIELSLQYGETLAAWDEFSPVMHEMSVRLEADDGSLANTHHLSFAVREFSTHQRQFTMNARPVMLRGPVENCVFPLTGYPAMDKAAWLRILKICKSYGFNFVRFHSYCPPDAAFQAADEEGFMYQVELPLWAFNVGEDPPRDEFEAQELLRILKTYGNHPCFCTMVMGNESSGPGMPKLIELGINTDPRRLYYGEYVEAGQWTQGPLRGVRGPQTNWDNDYITDTIEQPVLVHEAGQWCMYANFKEIRKYTGTQRAYNFELFRQSLMQHHMLAQAEAFRLASGALAVEVYKEEIESKLRTDPLGGFEVLDSCDFPGQGTALVGWLDAFWDSKGLITPEAFRRFCGPTVCLLRMSKREWTATENFTAEAQVSHFGPHALEQVHPFWSLADSHGHVLSRGQWPRTNIKTGGLKSLGNVYIPLSEVQAPARLVVTVGLTGTGISNSWNIWVFPALIPEDPRASVVHIAHALDAAAIAALTAGQRVLLFSAPQDLANAIQGSFIPVFWDFKLFPTQIGTMGLLIDHKHPALTGFPTSSHSDWQWADLLGNYSGESFFPSSMIKPWHINSQFVKNRSKAIILDKAPPDFRPIVQVIDNYDRNHKLGTIFEAQVGAGKLLVCAMDLDTDIKNRPAARQLRHGLLAYVAGSEFNPRYKFTAAEIQNLIGK
ncbi:MAG: twin-arginine translocation signal domain-containing protein [Planctomycetia bacterium]|nr:twin-arginine translocation signal domain-containing protein [Planctomycetia bacterium]